MIGAARELRCVLRAFRRSPGFAATLLLTLALGAGTAVPVLALVESGTSHSAPIRSPAGLELPLRDAGIVSASQPDDPPGETTPSRGSIRPRPQSGGVVIADVQAEALGALLWTVGAAAVLVLVIACGNLALLLLSRGAARHREIAMRTALGATRRRLAGQLFGEGMLVAAAGLTAGAALGMGGIAVLRASWPDALARWLDPMPGATAMLLALIPLLLTTLAFSLAPALAAQEGRLRDLLASGGRTTAGPREGIARDRLAVIATATSLVLLTGAVLLLRGLGSAHASPNPGFDPSDTLTLEMGAPNGPLTDPLRRAAHVEAVLREVRKVPGVRAASLASQGAWMGLGTTGPVQSMTGSASRPGIVRPTRYVAVSPGYFGALGTPLRSGREFTAADRAGSPAVVVVSETFAHRFFPGVDPVGKHVQPGRLSLDGMWYTVVGVVGDVRPPGIGTSARPEPVLYLSALQVPPAAAGIAVRAGSSPLDLAPAVEVAIRRAAPDQEILGVGTMEEYLARYREPLRWLAFLFVALALLSGGLAAAGLYGVVAYNVARRTREIGLRGALGAPPRALVGLIVRQGMGLAARGAMLGLLGAVCLGRLLQFHFHGIDPLDPAALGGTTTLLSGVAILASLVPARAAARVEPSIALRAE